MEDNSKQTKGKKTKGWSVENETLDNQGNTIKKGVFVGTKPTQEVKVDDSMKTYIDGLISDNEPFKILKDGILIFNSIDTLRKDYPIFNENGFILGDETFIYRGISITK